MFKDNIFNMILRAQCIKKGLEKLGKLWMFCSCERSKFIYEFLLLRVFLVIATRLLMDRENTIIWITVTYLLLYLELLSKSLCEGDRNSDNNS